MKFLKRMKNNIFHEKISILIGIFLGIFFLQLLLPEKNIKPRFNELALGETNKTIINSIENKMIHCRGLSDLNLCLDGYNNSNVTHPVVMWLGNSQLHVINQYHPGEETAVPQLHRYLKKEHLYTISFSQANANLQEHYLLFAHLLNIFPIETLILPIVFDDMREDGIRTDIKNILNDELTLQSIEKTLTGKSLLSRYVEKDLAGNKSNKSNDTTQDNFENFLEKRLAKIWPLWNERETLRGQLIGNLYFARNSIFGIKATSTRKMIRGRYIKNKNAYQDILNLALKNNIEVLAYISPIRNDIKIPYNLGEYNQFKKEIMEITKDSKFHFVSLENLIPSKFWGKKVSTNLNREDEIDFMHFQAGGHRLLAKAIYLEISKIWNN